MAAEAVFTEPIRRWFLDTFGSPTSIQRLAWPALSSGQHVLLSAPTGSGKTLAAFLPILDHLRRDPGSGLRCLYLSPLKALATDVRKNLRRARRGIARYLPEQRLPLRFGLRTGDTSARVRRQQRLQPPDVLLTTPESLAVLLGQPMSRDLFAALRWVVVDEIHSLAATKRGADLALSLERLTELTGPVLQRIGLSATCTPLDEAARFLAGDGRDCTVAQVSDAAALELRIEPLPESGAGFLARLLDRLTAELSANRTTLIFTNARGLAERVTWALRRRFPAEADRIAAHHSSLAASRRRLVERRLKQGRLWAVVSSTSLELGIDIGSVDGVVLVHPPGGVIRLLQRVGRSGHAPGQPRRGLVLTDSAAELLEATVTAASGHSAQLEPLRMPAGPLDVLCQHLLGMAAQRPWELADALGLVRRAYPYRALSQADADDCLDYLSGRHRAGHAWLPARLSWDGDTFRIRDERTARLVRRNLGTILTEEACRVQLGDGPWLGEVDEAFADRLRPGDRFLLDGRCLEFRRTEGAALRVEETAGYPATPRWQGTGWPLAPELARRLATLRLRAAEALRDGPRALIELLGQEYRLDEAATQTLLAYFQRQECVSEIPDPSTCLVEIVRHDLGVDHYVHTPVNRSANDALGRVVVRRLVRNFGRSATSLVADLGFLLSVGSDRELSLPELRALLSVEEFDDDLHAALADSHTLRERFRLVALTGLMLLRQPFGRRRVGGPDWAERRLFEQVRQADPDFVLLRQARREVGESTLDAAAARAWLAELPRCALHTRWLSQASPFAESWTQLAVGAVERVETPVESLQRLHRTLMTAEA